MADGQQIDSATGTLGDSRLVPLRSRKTGTGAATQQLLGAAFSAAQGAFAAGQRLTGHALASAQGAVTASAPASWTSYPTLTYTEGVSTQTSPINLGGYVSGYNALTDMFQLVGGPTWLILSGNQLYANGTQVDGDDTTVNIGVSRSGGAYVYTGPLTVTVSVAGSGVATWVEWGQFSYANSLEQAAVGSPEVGGAADAVGGFGNWLTVEMPADYAAWQAAVARKNDSAQLVRIIRPIYGGYYDAVWDDERPLIAVIPG